MAVFFLSDEIQEISEAEEGTIYSSHEDLKLLSELQLDKLKSYRGDSDVFGSTPDDGSLQFMDMHEHDLNAEHESGFDEEVSDSDVVQQDHNLVKMISMRKGHFKMIGNAIAIKPYKSRLLNGDSSSKINFKLSSSVKNGDQIRIYCRFNAATEDFRTSLPKPEATKLCDCAIEHQPSVFCVEVSNPEDGRLTWSRRGSPSARVDVHNREGVVIQFSSLFLSSDLKYSVDFNQRRPLQPIKFAQLVFQTKKENITLEQIFYVKTVASPDRDIKSFVKELRKNGMVVGEETKSQPFSLNPGAFKVIISEDHEQDLEKFVQRYGGSMTPFELKFEN